MTSRFQSSTADRFSCDNLDDTLSAILYHKFVIILMSLTMLHLRSLHKLQYLGELITNLSYVNNIKIAKLHTRSLFANGKRLEGKVAIVTGSTEGIGYAISKRLALEGAQVIISSRKQSNVDKALNASKAEGLNICGIVCHVGKKEDREALVNYAVKEKGGIDILIANAGMNPYFGRTLDTPEDTWNKVFDINLKSTFLLTQLVVPYMEKRGSGSIVYVSSFAGLNPVPEIGAYSITKTALLGLTKVIAMECGPNNIRVNCIAPGLIKTHLSEMMWKTESVKNDYEEKTMLKRIGTPEEMGGLAAFLCSDDASYITGEVISATGGIPSRL